MRWSRNPRAILRAWLVCAATVAAVLAHGIVKGPMIAIAPPVSGLDTNGIFLVWHMDETWTNPRVSSDIYALSLTNVGTVTNIAGILTNAIDLERTGSQYFVLNPPTTNLVETALGDNFTWTAWVMLESHPTASGVYGIVTKMHPGVSPTGEYALYAQESGGLTRALFATGRNNSGSTADTVTCTEYLTNTAEWYFVAAGHNNTAGSNWISLNGQARTWAARTTGPSASTTRPFRVGLFGTATHFFDGRIDYVTYWKTNLTDTQLTGLYGSGAPPYIDP